jgi:triacylglycerol esterase/lipase EstA (alpha/beta hydrolase family)
LPNIRIRKEAMKNGLAFLLLILTAAPLLAQDKEPCGNDGPAANRCSQSKTEPQTSSRIASISSASTPIQSLAAPPGPVTSPIKPESVTDWRFVVNGGQGLDTGCTYRSGGPLKITIPIDRVVGGDGAVDSQGSLINAQYLVERGVVGKYATLRMPVYDIDLAGSPPEIDRVLFNGHPLPILTGEDGTWKLNTFSVPIEWVHFARRAPGSNPTAANTRGINVLEIQIDTASPSGEQNWCMQVDWAELTFQAMYPVVMVHGHNNYGGFFDSRGFTQVFKDQKMPYDNSITMSSAIPNDNGSIESHGAYLASRIPAIAAEFGSKHIHIIAHSKGGIDTREFLTKVPSNFGVLSLFTISTPHGGTVLADYVMDAREANIALSEDMYRVEMARWYPYNANDEGFKQMRVGRMQDFNNKNLAVLPSSFTVDGETLPMHGFALGADANVDGSTNIFGQPIITDNELEGIPSLGGSFRDFFARRLAAQSVYRLLSDTKKVELVDMFSPVINPPGIPPLYLGKGLVEVRADKFEPNDLIVTVSSAHELTSNPSGLFDRSNHATVIREQTAVDFLLVLKDVEAQIQAKR